MSKKAYLSVVITILLSWMGIPLEAGLIISPVNKPSDLDFSGNVKYANNFGNNGNPNVGGYIFSQDQAYPSITLNALGEGPATWWGPYPGTADAGLNLLLNGLLYRYGTPPFEISINAGGLIVGKPYLLQMIGYEPQNESRNIDIFVENYAVVTGLNPIVAQGGVVGKGGFVIKYNFTAMDPILNIRMVSHSSACAMSGFILTEIPEPATLSLIALGSLFFRRRS